MSDKNDAARPKIAAKEFLWCRKEIALIYPNHPLVLYALVLRLK